MENMKISLITVGKLKEKYLKQGIAEYTKRLGPYTNIEIVELPDEKAPENLSAAEEEEVKRKEGQRILNKISTDTYVFTLEIKGKQLTSEQLSQKIDELTTYGKSKIAFVIGGSLGLSEEVMERSDMALSFSKMTFPHQLMRLILLEQVYRAFKILRNEPYHK
ncbi:23S rRNA (pseudouridine(1915)-N(3))-methyltransferase RlmH [Salinibacillus aidingensis]|uniref:Ribosomal RNA large subunit methyltransferase H n=2 Tax=Salinibacillus aidingensis TaxID=237684 RepID=A0ABN1BNX5_9BACI